jgi:hypothetical protein
MPPVQEGGQDLPRNNDLVTSGYLEAVEVREENLNTVDEICTVLRDAIFGPEKSLPRAEGIIIVTGSTNAGKSTIVRGLIHKYLQARLRETPKRRPHLVTFEDPIEAQFTDPDPASVTDPTGCLRTGVDYTPRQIGLDVATLDSAIKDALRQTPEVFYVGEVRDPGHWRKLVDFAGTGHLTVTTAHAGSLPEAMRNVFRATTAKTPAGRSMIAERISAVVHLRLDKLQKDISEKTGVRKMIVPSVWRRTPEGVMAIMEYGLSSVLPDRKSAPVPRGPRVKKSCLGRAWFVEHLIDVHCHALDRPAEDFQPLIVEAAGWDLEGR